MRTIIDIPNDLLAKLDERLGEEKISRAEVIRRAIKLWLGLNKPSHPSVFGIWENKYKEGLEYQKSLRADWSDD